MGKLLMGWWACRSVVAALVCACLFPLWVSAPEAAAGPTWSSAANSGFREFAGSGDGSPVAWSYSTDLWGPPTGASWWQSAVGIGLLARYGQLTGQLRRPIQTVLRRTYSANVSKAGGNFTDKFMDDTAWWGLGWLAAARYELYFGDQADAARFLKVAEADASYIARQPRVCGGISWTTGGAPHTISQASFVALTAGLARLRGDSGPLHNARRAASWLSDAKRAWEWLARSGLVDVTTGEVTKDSVSDNSCDQLQGGPVSYTQGEVADALVQLGRALDDASYYNQAGTFLLYAINSTSPFVFGGVLQDRCEALSPNCSANPIQQDITAFKGILVQAMSDWTSATLSDGFIPFVEAQASAVLANDVLAGADQSPPCSSPQQCQFGMSWARPVASTLVSPGTQESALTALTAALSATVAARIDHEPVRSGGALPERRPTAHLT